MNLVLAILDGTQRQIELGSGGPWRIGRHPPCEIVVTDKFISSEHAELSLTPKGLLLRQLKSFNPVLVENEPIESAVLQAGACFTIGKTKFKIVDMEVEESGRRTSFIDSHAIFSDAKGHEDESSGHRLSAAQCMKEISQITEIREEDDLNRAAVHWICNRLRAQREIGR